MFSDTWFSYLLPKQKKLAPQGLSRFVLMQNNMRTHVLSETMWRPRETMRTHGCPTMWRPQPWGEAGTVGMHHPHTQSLINPFSHHRVPTNRRKKTATVAKSLSLLSVMVKSGLSTVIQRSHFRSHFLPHLKNWWLKEDGVSWCSAGWSTGRWVLTCWIERKLHLITEWRTMKRSIWVVSYTVLFSFLRSGTLGFQNKIWLLCPCDV